MLILIAFGVGMFVLGVAMVLKPMSFSDGIISFSEKPWFHLFEITSRLVFGLLLIYFAGGTAYPTLVFALGMVLCCVSFLLIFVGAERHKKFALLTAKIGKRFRPLGAIAIVCGLSLVYIGIV